MTEPSFSPRALADLEEIIEYVGQDSPDAAERLVALIVEKCERLARFPRIGASR